MIVAESKGAPSFVLLIMVRTNPTLRVAVMIPIGLYGEDSGDRIR
jgi:hypothetical protein